MPTYLPSFLDSKEAPDTLRRLIVAIADACRDIGQTVNNSAINDLQGELSQENVQGEVQKELDVIANDMMLEPARWDGLVSALASEEMDTIHPLPTKGDYLLTFDPIDGSSNINVNGLVGTIFSVLNAPEDEVFEEDFLKAGREQVAAGYAIYGPQTTLLFTLGQGVHAFTLNRETGEWVLINESVRLPESTAEFAINMAYQRHWHAPLRQYIDDCLAGKDGPRGKDFNMRWLASMVGDLHRILTRGGIFIYPTDTRKGSENGKLRLLYEVAPFSFLIEQAGGMATNGTAPVLDIVPDSLHQRVGVVIGVREEVEKVKSYH
ncbi:MAG: class 1 fructose-bisphosphatase [Asticcacaulis sp.]